MLSRWYSSKGEDLRWRMFSTLPVERLSRRTTRSPRSRSRSARCEPIKPAPPVIRKRKEPSLKSLRIVVVMSRDDLARRLRDFTLCCIRSFLRTVTVRIRIIPVGIVIIRGAGIDGVKHHAEDAGLHTGEQIARSRERHLGSL